MVERGRLSSGGENVESDAAGYAGWWLSRSPGGFTFRLGHSLELLLLQRACAVGSAML